MLRTYLLLRPVVGDNPGRDKHPAAEGTHVLAALGADPAQMRDYTQPVPAVAPGLLSSL